MDDMFFESGSDLPFDRVIAPRSEQFDRESRAPRKVSGTISDSADLPASMGLLGRSTDPAVQATVLGGIARVTKAGKAPAS